MGRLPRRNLGAGVYYIYNRCANNLWILDSPECKNKFLELLERLSGKYELNMLTASKKKLISGAKI